MGHTHKGYFSPGELKEMTDELSRGDTKGESAREREERAIAIIRQRQRRQSRRTAGENLSLKQSGLGSLQLPG